MKDVLLVEDNPADVYLIHKALVECGNDIRLWSIPNGQDALGFFRQEGPYLHAPAPALILLDLQLPKLYGDALLVELRRLPAYRETPVVVFSAVDKVIGAPLALGLGANEYVQKPFDFYAYVDALKTVVSHWLM